MILYAPFANYAYTLNLLNSQGFHYENFILRFKDGNVYAYKNGVDSSKEFIEQYHKDLIKCLPKVEFLPYQKCKCFCPDEEIFFKDQKDFFKSIDETKISVFGYSIDATCLNFVLKHCQVWNCVVNPYELLLYVFNTYKFSESWIVMYVFNYFDVCLELKKRGYSYKHLACNEVQFFDTDILNFDFKSVDKTIKEKTLQICKNYFDCNNKKVNLLKEFGF